MKDAVFIFAHSPSNESVCAKMIHSTSAPKGIIDRTGWIFASPHDSPLALSTPEGASAAWNDTFHHCPNWTMMEQGEFNVLPGHTVFEKVAKMAIFF